MRIEPNSFDYVQNIFEQTLQETESAGKAVSLRAFWRRWLAYFLKGVAVFGGIAIAAGLNKEAAHFVGIAIAVAVAIDGLFLNHTKLLAATKGASAYKYLLKDIRNEHQKKLAPILAKKADDLTAAMEKLTELNLSLKDRLDSESKTIDQALNEVDIKALNSLSLDLERKAGSG